MKLHNSLLTGLVLVAFWPSDLHQIREVQAFNFGGGGMRAFGAGLGLMGGGGGMGGRRGVFGGFSLSPPGPAFLPEVNSSTTWGDVVWDVLQLLLDYCKTPRLCNATELGLFSEYDSKCSDCHPCACDDSCYARGDCCLDKVLLETLQDRAVLDTPAIEPSELETVSSCRNTYLTESIQATHHSIITACPQTFTGNSDVVDRCSASQPPPLEASPPSSKPSYDDMFKFDYFDFGDYGGGATTTTTAPNPIEIINSTASFWPLWSRETRRVYGNADCASCHGQTPGYQLVPWNLRVDCDRSVRLQGDAPTADTVIHDALQEPSCELSFLPPAEETASSCLPQRGQYIDSCNVTGRRHDYDAALWKACDVFRGQISVDDVTYKNVFCALCNEDQLDAYGKCKDPKTFPFFLVVNASVLGSSSMQATGREADEESDKEEKEDMCHCPNGHVYDPHQMVCRQLQCGMTRVLQQVDHNSTNNNNSTTIDHDTNPQQQQKKKNKQQQQYECVPLIVNSTGLLYELSLRLVPLMESKVVYLDDAAAFKQVARNIRTSFVLQGSTRSGWHVTFHHLRVIFEIHGEKEEDRRERQHDEQKNGVVASERRNDNRCDAVLLKIGEKADGKRKFAAITTVFVKGSLENETEFGKTQEGTKKVSKGVKVVSVRVHIKFAADWPEPADALEKRLHVVTSSLWNISVGGDAGKISFRAEPSYITPHDRERLPDGPFPEAGLYTPPDLKSSSCSLEYAVDIPDRSTDPLLLPTNDKYLTVAEILACPRVAFNLSSTLEEGNDRSGEGEKIQKEDAVLKLDEKSGSVHHLPSGKEIGFQFAEVSGDGSEMLICADQLYEHVDGVKRAAPDIVLPDLTALMPVGQTQQSVLTGRVLLACQILSLLLLAAVILVLLCCPELLTLQGKLTLNLSLATLLTLLVLGFGAGRTDELSDGWCVAVGVICHYCLLSAFFWLSAAVYNAYCDARRACGATRTEDGRNNKETGTFTKLTAACILLPVAVIALTMLINHLMRGRQAGCHLQLGYGLGICFLSDTWNILFAAVLPISIITVFCLALCLSGACTRTRMSMERTQSHRPALLGLIIHIPLTLAMSGCALCGLVAVLQRDDAALWFSFAGLSVLMGLVFVFVFIIWDKRTLKILRARLSSACSCCCCCGANTGLRDRRFRKDEFAPISNEGRLE